MKTQYSQRRRYSTDGRSGFPIVWGFGIAVLVVAVLFGLHAFTPNLFSALVSPLWQSGTGLATEASLLSAELDSKQKLATENAALEQQVQTLQSENEVLTARSQDLTKLLGGTSGAGNELLAGVLARPPESPYDTLTVAAGSSDGSVAGALVYSAGGIPIGTIRTVSNNTSEVSLYSTSGRSTDAWIGQDRLPVTLTGVGGGAFTASVPVKSVVAVGDTVYVAGPGALPIGSVIKIASDPSSPNEVLDIQPIVNLFSITWVEIARQ
ncbi:MAG: rod shape-determining protein MreC [Candidatus Pacebacteria bacterium]|nr:rod shape-determining protein MreC [Candidatus Paceibacterota bacterium]